MVTYSWAGLLLSTLLGLLIQGPYAANEGLGQLFNAQLVQATLDSKLGTMSQARELMAFLAGGAASLLLPPLPGAGRRARIAIGVMWAVLTITVAASWALYDHASTGVQAPWGGVPPTSSTWTRWPSGSAGSLCSPVSRCAGLPTRASPPRCPGSLRSRWPA